MELRCDKISLVIMELRCDKISLVIMELRCDKISLVITSEILSHLNSTWKTCSTVKIKDNAPICSFCLLDDLFYSK